MSTLGGGCKTCGAGPPAPGTACIDFVIADFILAGSFYTVNLVHNLSAGNVHLQIFEGLNRVWVDLETKIDSNTHQIKVPVDPDLRFDGRACFVRTS